MSIGIGGHWNEYYELELQDKAWLLSLSEKARKAEMKRREKASKAFNKSFSKNRKIVNYTPGYWTPLGPINNK